MTNSFPLPPTLSPKAPVLPRRWQGVALLTPYRNGEIFAAEVQYDWGNEAMMVTLWGLEGSAQQRLYVGDQFFVLTPAGEKGAKKVGPLPSVTPVPAPDWLAPHGMSHVGSGEVMGVDCDWWVGFSPNVNGYQTGTTPPVIPQVCNWVWTRRESNLPFRLFFTNFDNPYRLPGLGDFSTTIFTEFKADETVDLGPLVAEVRAGAEAPPAEVAQAVAAATTSAAVQAALAALDMPAAVDPVVKAGNLIKGLAPPPKDAPLPEWDERLCITGYTYPTAKSPQLPPVLPMRVFYDWTKKRMLTRCALTVSEFDQGAVQDLILDASITHIVIRNPDGSHVCGPTVPVGLPKPHWAKDAGGLPKAVIRNNPVLGPDETIHVTTIASTGERWFWVWYTPQNDGRLFMETPQFGDVGLVLTDYARFDHSPPPFPDEAFVVPADCLAKSGN